MAVSPEAVTWAYRFFLGREPESQEVIAAHLSAQDATHLARLLISSGEFTSRKRHLALRLPTERPELARLEVESEATPAEIAACLEKIEAAWSHLGAVRPHFSVLSQEKFRPDRLPEGLDDFWDSGQREAGQVLATLARHEFAISGKTCVEYGCGVGRVTVGLAARFARVDAYDISTTHLELARQRVRDSGVSNVRFHECPTTAMADLEACDVFYSRIVFQHNPPPVIAELIRRALTALRPGGIAIFQVPSHLPGYSFKLRQWLQTDHALDMQMHCLPQQRTFALINESRCTVLEVREDSATAARADSISNTFVVQKQHPSLPRGLQASVRTASGASG